MDHHTTRGKGRTLALLTCHKKDSTHRGCHTGADGGYITGDKLHGVVDTKSGSDTATRGIDIDGDVFAWIYRVEIQQLSLKGVGCIVVNLCAKEYDTIHHKTREHVHLGHIKLSLLQNIRVEILSLLAHNIIQDHPVNTEMLGRIFSKFIHNSYMFQIVFYVQYIDKNRRLPTFLFRSWNKINKKSR